jgi:hypothetical protein
MELGRAIAIAQFRDCIFEIEKGTLKMKFDVSGKSQKHFFDLLTEIKMNTISSPSGYP